MIIMERKMNTENNFSGQVRSQTLKKSDRQSSFLKGMLSWRIMAVFMLLLAGFSCSLIKMAPLFMAGRIDKQDYYAEVDFIYRRGLILVPVQINGESQTYHFILDTGAALNVVSTAIAERFAVGSRVDSTMVDSQGNKEKIHFTTLKAALNIGGLSFTGTGTAIFDLDRSPALSCYEADGAIGMNLIRLIPYWHIDFQRRKLILTDQEKRLPASSSPLILPFKQSMQRIPEITLEWWDLRLPFRVDLGSAHGFVAPWDYWEKMRGRNQEMPYVTGCGEIRGGALGVAEESCSLSAILENARLGKSLGRKIMINVYQNPFASVGTEFFCLFLVTFDWSKKEIRLTPWLEESDPALSTFGFNFSWHEQDHCLYVNYIYRDSPAARAGMAVGDRILQINGLDLTDLNLNGYCRFFLEPKTLFGTEEIIQLRLRGENEDRIIELHKEVILQ